MSLFPSCPGRQQLYRVLCAKRKPKPSARSDPVLVGPWASLVSHPHPDYFTNTIHLKIGSPGIPESSSCSNHVKQTYLQYSKCRGQTSFCF